MSNIKTKFNVIINPIIPQRTVSEQGTPMASSLDVATVFEKEHKNILGILKIYYKIFPMILDSSILSRPLI